MDLLGDVLGSLTIFSQAVGTFDVAAPWAFSVEAKPPTFVFAFSIIEGDFWLRVQGQDPVRLGTGDSALLTGGLAHVYGSAADIAPLSLERFWVEQHLPGGWEVAKSSPIYLKQGEGTTRTRFFITAFMVQEPARNPVLAELPALILVPRGAGGFDLWLDAATRFCEREHGLASPGFSATAKHLTELMFSSLVRAHVGTAKAVGPGWMRGLSNPQIGRALAIMHQRPGERWSAAGLAEEVGMSRATFARKFRVLVGRSPIDYLTDCRMQHAAQMIIEGRQPVGRLAEKLGYRSERAFREAFRQRFGLSPSRYRQCHRDQLQAGVESYVPTSLHLR